MSARDISSKTRVPIGWLFALVTSFAVIVFYAVIVSMWIGGVQKTAEAASGAVSKLEDKQEKEYGVIIDKLETLQQQTARIEGQLKHR